MRFDGPHAVIGPDKVWILPDRKVAQLFADTMGDRLGGTCAIKPVEDAAEALLSAARQEDPAATLSMRGVEAHQDRMRAIAAHQASLHDPSPVVQPISAMCQRGRHNECMSLPGAPCGCPAHADQLADCWGARPSSRGTWTNVG